MTPPKKKQRGRTPTPRTRPAGTPVDPATVRLEKGKGSAGRGAGLGGSYWHIYAADQRAGHVYINVIDEEPIGSHASVQIQLNVNAQSRGIGSVAYRLAVEQSGHDIVYAHMRKSNVASRKAATKAGFEVVEDAAMAQLLMVWRRSR